MQGTTRELPSNAEMIGTLKIVYEAPLAHIALSRYELHLQGGSGETAWHCTGRWPAGPRSRTS